MKKYFKAFITFFIAAVATAYVMAEPTSALVSIGTLRPYSGGNIVFLYTTTNLCATPPAFYSIDLSTNAGKAVYAAALAALATGKQVNIEIAASGCGTGPSGSTSVQSIYISQ